MSPSFKLEIPTDPAVMALLVMGLDQAPYPLSVVAVGVALVVDMLLRDKDAKENRMLPLLWLIDDEKGDDDVATIENPRDDVIASE